MVVEKYSNIRRQIKTGDLLAWKSGRIGSKIDLVLKLYQKIFKAQYIHVGVAVVLGNRVLMVDATPPIVRLYPLSYCDDFYWFPCNLEYKEKYLDILFKHLGKPYRLFDLINSLLGFKNSTDDFYCSELAGYFYKEIGFIQDEDAGFVPDTIVEAILKASGVKEPTFILVDRGNA